MLGHHILNSPKSPCQPIPLIIIFPLLGHNPQTLHNIDNIIDATPLHLHLLCHGVQDQSCMALMLEFLNEFAS